MKCVRDFFGYLLGGILFVCLIPTIMWLASGMPELWPVGVARAVGAAVLMGVGLLLLPALNPMFEHPLDLYRQMGEMLTQHGDSGTWAGLLFAPVLRDVLLPNMRAIQLGVLAVLAAIFFWKYRLWSNYRFRVTALPRESAPPESKTW